MIPDVALSNLLSRLRGGLKRLLARPAAGGLDAAEEDGGASAQAVKETIARKRRNEQVRRREFDHLRQLRHRGIGVGGGGGGGGDGGSQLSLFDDAPPASADEREQTLRKIDQAEARMARAQWRAAPARAAALSDATLPPADGAPIEGAHMAGFAPTALPEAPDAALGPHGCATPAAPPLAAAAQAQPDIDPALERIALRLALGDTQAAGEAAPSAPAGAPALAGELRGDIDAVLAALEAGRAQAPLLVVSCAQLMRVDFAAAGCLLDWARARQARGCQVQLREVSPPVADFLRLVGLTEHAQVAQRTG